MKRMLVLSIVAVLPLLASAQFKAAENWSEIEISTFARNVTLGTPIVSYDLIKGERVVYSGIAVQLIRAPQPLHLLNPWAPKAYEPTQQSVAVDPITKRPVGLRFFVINF